VWAAAKRVDATERDAFLRLLPFQTILVYDPFHDGAAAHVNANQSAMMYPFALGTGSPMQITDELDGAGLGRGLANPVAQRRTVQTASLSRDLEMHGLGNEPCHVFFVSGVHENMLRSLVSGIDFERTFLTSLFFSEPTWMKSVQSQFEVRGFSVFITDNKEQHFFARDHLHSETCPGFFVGADASACDLRVTILEPCATCLVDGPGLPFRLLLRIDLVQPTSASSAHADGDGSDTSSSGQTEVVVFVRLLGRLMAEIVQPITSTNTTIEAWITPQHRRIEDLKMNFLLDRMLTVDVLSECRGVAVSAGRVIRQLPPHAFFAHAGLDPRHWPPTEPADADGDFGTAGEAEADGYGEACSLRKSGSAVGPGETVAMEGDCADYSVECLPAVQATLQLLGLPTALDSATHTFSGAAPVPASMCALIAQSPVPLHLRCEVRPARLRPGFLACCTRTDGAGACGRE
jgi:hypothetical protein